METEFCTPNSSTYNFFEKDFIKIVSIQKDLTE